MLVLTRKPGDCIYLFTSDGPVKITLVTGICSRIGIDAPEEIEIGRDGGKQGDENEQRFQRGATGRPRRRASS